MGLSTHPFSDQLVQNLKVRPTCGVSLYWLGQAGFLIDTGSKRLLIDPYLSDSLAEKYRDRGFSHERMIAPPIAIADLTCQGKTLLAELDSLVRLTQGQVCPTEIGQRSSLVRRVVDLTGESESLLMILNRALGLS